VRVLITRAWAELETRGLAPALRMLHDARGAAVALGDPVLIALSHIQEGTVHGRVGDWAACLAALDQVGPGEAGLNPAQRCALHINRGQAQLGIGDTEGAASSFELVRDIASENGFREQEFKARHNRVVVAFVDGDLPRALHLMREADAMDATVSRDRARLDLAEVLLEAGLVDDARSALAQALPSARADGHRLEEGEISLRLARCDLLVDDLDGARRHTGAATAAYRSRQAEELVGEAEIMRARIDVAAVHDVATVVTTLTTRSARPGIRPAALREAVRLEAEARLLLGDVDGAERRLAALPDAHRDSLAARLHEALVRARLDHAKGRDAEVEHHIVSGNRLLAAQQFQSSSLDVRAALALHGRRLAAFDAERALAAGNGDGILTSIERWRAVSHRINPVATASHPEVTALTRELRRLRQLLADDPGDPSGDLAARVALLEDHVAQREWALAADEARSPAMAAVDADEARAAASQRDVTVVEFFELDGRLWTIEVSQGRVTTRRSVPVEEVYRLVTRLRRDLRARAIVAPESPMAQMLERATTSSLSALDTVLNPHGPTRSRVVVVPSRALAGVPWSLLPSLQGRPVTVAPSLTRWVRGPARPTGATWTRPVAALYGPGLSHTGPEIRAIRAAWSDVDDAGALAPATSEEVLHALGASRVVHLAAHGVHEAQSPLFSSVQVSDGPVFAHEFPRPVAAEHVALSACDVGQFSTRPGDEPLGLAIALISLGATSVLGAVAPVADHVAAEAMVAYHRLVAGGADASTAWASVVEQQPAAGVFCYYGSDWSVGSSVVR
jgi:tetratricopeptide (TPR) repeat protein